MFQRWPLKVYQPPHVIPIHGDPHNTLGKVEPNFQNGSRTALLFHRHRLPRRRTPVAHPNNFQHTISQTLFCNFQYEKLCFMTFTLLHDENKDSPAPGGSLSLSGSFFGQKLSRLSLVFSLYRISLCMCLHVVLVSVQ